MKKQIDIRLVVLLSITTLLGIWRVTTASAELSTWASFSPLGAMALFGGTYFSNKYHAFMFPILILFVSDFIMMQTIYAPYREGLLYGGWYWNYGSFLLMVTVGEQLKNNVSIKNFLLASFVAGAIHFVFSNFGTWLGGGTNLLTGLPYRRDIYGLINCYLAAIPYFKNLLLGNLIFGTALYGGFEWAQSKISILKPQTIHS